MCQAAELDQKLIPRGHRCPCYKSTQPERRISPASLPTLALEAPTLPARKRCWHALFILREPISIHAHAMRPHAAGARSRPARIGSDRMQRLPLRTRPTRGAPRRRPTAPALPTSKTVWRLVPTATRMALTTRFRGTPRLLTYARLGHSHLRARIIGGPPPRAPTSGAGPVEPTPSNKSAMVNAPLHTIVVPPPWVAESTPRLRTALGELVQGLAADRKQWASIEPTVAEPNFPLGSSRCGQSRPCPESTVGKPAPVPSKAPARSRPNVGQHRTKLASRQPPTLRNTTHRAVSHRRLCNARFSTLCCPAAHLLPPK